MLGAGIAVVVMLVVGPRFGFGVRTDPEAAPSSEPAPLPEQITEQPKPTSASMIAAPEHLTAPKKPAGMIRWWFSTNPAGAQVIIAGQPQGFTPTFVNVPIGEDPVEIRLELDGYEPHVLNLPPANDQSFTPQLRPLEADPAPAKTASKRPRTGKSKPGTDDAPSEEPKKDFIPLPDSLRDSGG
jgi:hypothetical protein